MNTSQEKLSLKDLIDAVLIEQDYMVLTKKFTQGELEQVLNSYTSQRIILIERKETEDDGFEIERINAELSNIKIEITKINKAIAELKKKPKKVKPTIVVEVSNDVLSNEEKLIIESIESCRTMPEVCEKHTSQQLEFGRNYYNNYRGAVIAEKNKPENAPHDSVFNQKLQHINNLISRINKAINEKERIAAKAIKREKKEVNPEKSIVFLTRFYDFAKLHIDSESFEKIKAHALSSKE